MQIDSYDSPEAEALLSAGQARVLPPAAGRERVTETVASGSFVGGAVALALLGPSSRSLSWGALALTLALFVVCARVRFPVSDGWTSPIQLALVPMLFLLPTPIVPLTAGLGMLIARAPDALRGEISPARTFVAFADSLFALAPALVLVAAGSQSFAWDHWPLYVAALVAQIALDLAAALARGWFADRIAPRVQLPLLAWTYLVDAALFAVALATAAVAARDTLLAALSLPLVGVFALFARERRARLGQVAALNSAYQGTALLLGDVVEADDAYTGSHSRGVLELSLTVADRLSLDALARRNVEFGALLHDVGKVRVPKEIINKPGPLDDDEWAIMHRHTVEGEAMLRQVGGVLADVGRVVRSSHERWDGRGYPDGLAREAIPIEARIVAACDAYSAITTDRPYRQARTPAFAIGELERCSGTQFDPRVVEALIAIVRSDARRVPAAEPELDAAAALPAATV